MAILKQQNYALTHSRYNKADLCVSYGEEFEVETELCTGNWLHSIHDLWDRSKSFGPNPTVVVKINQAKPGDVIAVKILDITLDELGYTGFDGRDNPLSQLIYPDLWGLNTRTVEIKDGFIFWSDTIRIPVKPMIGTIGTAPEKEEILNDKAGMHGGNMDISEVTAGNTIYLKAFVDGALLHIGDVHAIQGDGEINCAGGIECRAKLKLSVNRVPKPKRMKWIRIENDQYIMGIACCRSVEESFYASAREILCWLVDDYGLSREEAYLLMGLVLEARSTQFVNPTRSYISKFPKKYLHSAAGGGAT